MVSPRVWIRALADLAAHVTWNTEGDARSLDQEIVGACRLIIEPFAKPGTQRHRRENAAQRVESFASGLRSPDAIDARQMLHVVQRRAVAGRRVAIAAAVGRASALVHVDQGAWLRGVEHAAHTLHRRAVVRNGVQVQPCPQNVSLVLRRQTAAKVQELVLSTVQVLPVWGCSKLNGLHVKVLRKTRTRSAFA